MRLIKTFILVILLNYFSLSISSSEIVKDIKIEGNDRVTNEIILMFSNIAIGQDINVSEINEIIKNLYETNFFNNVSVSLKENIVSITVDEAPLIDSIIISCRLFKIVIDALNMYKVNNEFGRYIKLASLPGSNRTLHTTMLTKKQYN